MRFSTALQCVKILIAYTLKVLNNSVFLQELASSLNIMQHEYVRLEPVIIGLTAQQFLIYSYYLAGIVASKPSYTTSD